MRDKEKLTQKYDRGASTYATKTFAKPGSTAVRQLDLVRHWGAAAPAGGSVLELGCADGFVTEVLARDGLNVTGVDLSPGMIEAAKRRLADSGSKAQFMVADIDHLRLEDSYDVVCGIMRTFFHYLDDPRPVLEKLFKHTLRKVIVDVNPRTVGIEKACEYVQQAGFVNVAWRGFFVPQATALPKAILRLLRMGEQLPLITKTVVRRKFHVVIKGEKASPGY